MFSFFKSKEHKLFDGCDHKLAAAVLVANYSDSVIPNELAQLLDKYLENPGYKTAYKLVEKYPDCINYFEQCKPGGLFVRNGPLQKRY